MKFIFFLLAAIAHVDRGATECPGSHEELPTLYDDDTFMCAISWDGEGDDSALNSCIECDGADGINAGHLKYDGYDHTFDPPSQYGHFGSFLVKPGCTLTGWDDQEYEGEFREFDGTLLEPNNDWGFNWGDFEDGESPTPGCSLYGWGSYKCRCQQKMLDCVPEDGWETTLVCDNTDGVTAPLKCTYQQSIGTIYSDSTSESMGIDFTIAETISAGLFDIFSADLAFSETTEYDWTQVTEQTQQSVVTITVEAKAYPGEKLILEQAVGQCGGEQPRTEMFKSTIEDKAGEVVSVKYEHRGSRATGESPRTILERAKGDPNAPWRGNRNKTETRSFKALP